MTPIETLAKINEQIDKTEKRIKKINEFYYNDIVKIAERAFVITLVALAALAIVSAFTVGRFDMFFLFGNNLSFFKKSFIILTGALAVGFSVKYMLKASCKLALYILTKYRDFKQTEAHKIGIYVPLSNDQDQKIDE